MMGIEITTTRIKMVNKTFHHWEVKRSFSKPLITYSEKKIPALNKRVMKNSFGVV